MPRHLTLFVACIIATSSTTPATAHHAFAAVFNGDEAVEIQGTVTRLEWMNPHTWFYVTVDGDGDSSETWAFEMGSPNGLIRRGWSRNTLQVGQEVKVSGYRAKDGTEAASVKTVVFADGQQLSGASSKGERP